MWNSPSPEAKQAPVYAPLEAFFTGLVSLIIKGFSLTIIFSYKLHLDIISEQKKDPGIPNLFPFKEDILKQAEEKKRKVCRLMHKAVNI